MTSGITRAVATVLLLYTMVYVRAEQFRLAFTQSMNLPLVGAPAACYSAFQMAIAEINASPLLGGDTIVGSLEDINGATTGAFFRSLHANDFCNVTRSPVDIMIGPLTTADALNMAGALGVLGVPLISHGAATPELAVKSNYPTFRRTIGSNKHQARAMASLCASFSWYRVATIGTSDAFGNGLLQFFSPTAATLGIRILTSPSFPAGSSYAIVKGAMQQIKDSGARIIVIMLFGADWTQVQNAAAELGMKGAPYQYVTQAGMADTSFPGSVATNIYLNFSRPEFVSFQSRFRTAYPNVTFTPTISAISNGYDGVYLAADAIVSYQRIRDACRLSQQPSRAGWQFPGNICTMFNNLQRPALLNALLPNATVPNGATGPVVLDANGDRLQPWGIFNKPVTTGTILMGIADVSTDPPTIKYINTQPFLFLDGTSVVPLDRDVPRVDDSVSSSIDIPSLVLAFGIAVLGSWTALILVEQTVSAQSGLEQGLWLAASSGALGIGMWASVIIGMTALSFPSLSAVGALEVAYAQVNVFTALLIAFPAAVLAFGVMTMSLAASKKPRGGESRLAGLSQKAPSQYVSQTGREPDSTVEIVDAGLVDDEGNTLADVSKPSGDSNTKRGLTLGVSLIVSAFLIVGGVSGVHWLIFVSLASPLKSTVGGDKFVLALVLSFIFTVPALYGYFNLRVSKYRFVAALIMACGIDSAHFTFLVSATFKYTGSTLSSDIGPLVLKVVGSAVACIVSFIFVGLNVTRLRLSKDVLDRFLLQAQQKIRMQEIMLKQRDLVNFEQTVLLQMIQGARPLVRKNHHLLVNLNSGISVGVGVASVIGTTGLTAGSQPGSNHGSIVGTANRPVGGARTPVHNKGSSLGGPTIAIEMRSTGTTGVASPTAGNTVARAPGPMGPGDEDQHSTPMVGQSAPPPPAPAIVTTMPPSPGASATDATVMAAPGGATTTTTTTNTASGSVTGSATPGATGMIAPAVTITNTTAKPPSLAATPTIVSPEHKTRGMMDPSAAAISPTGQIARQKAGGSGGGGSGGRTPVANKWGSSANLQTLGFTAEDGSNTLEMPGLVNQSVAAAGTGATGPSGAISPQNRSNNSNTKQMFNAILGNPVTLELFKDVCVANRNSENISFLMDALQYKQCENSAQRRIIAMDIAGAYIEDGSPNTLNVEASLRSSIVEKVRREDFSNDLFNAVYTEVMRLVERNDFARFLSTPQCDVALAALQICANLAARSKLILSPHKELGETSMKQARSHLNSAFGNANAPK